MSESQTKAKVKQKNKSNTAIKLIEKGVHPIVLFYGISFTLIVLYSSLISHRLPLLVATLILCISSFITYYNFFGRKIVITTHKIYFYRLGKKTITLTFSKDFLHMKYEKTNLGKLLGYGSILLVTQEEKYYKIHFIHNPEEIFTTSIEAYENIMVSINPNYERKLNVVEKNNRPENFEKIED